MPEGERLSFDDVQILKLENAAIRGHTAKLTVVEADSAGAPLSAAALREHVAERIEGVPRLSERVSMAGRGEPRWEPDPDFDLANHVVEHPDRAPLSEDQLRARVGEVMGERLDHERPLWQLDLVAVEGGRTGIVGRFHHCMADGVTCMKLLSGILWDPREEAAGGGSATPASAAPAGAGKPKRSAPAPEAGRLRRLARLPGTIFRELRPGADSPLDRHIGTSREVAWTAVPLTELKRIEHAAGEGVTVNDVVLAAVSGALRSWLSEAGVQPAKLKAQVPVSLHTREEGAGVGNRDSFLFVDLPVSEPDPIRRLRLINAETRERKLDHDAETLYSFFHSLSHFRPLYREVTRLTSGPREFALSVSNVPGPREPVTITGRRLSRFCSFAEPADRHALRVAVVSLGGEVAFGFCSDPDAVPALDRIAASLSESLAELERDA
jgi:diacylglycerol O-acyltransferase